MSVLVIHDGIAIKGWLVGERKESAPVHIKNGYSELQASWDEGRLAAVELDVPTGDEYRVDLYEVQAGNVQRKG